MFWLVVFSPAIFFIVVGGLAALGLLSLDSDTHLALHYLTMGAQIIFLICGFIYEATVRSGRWPKKRKTQYYVLLFLLFVPPFLIQILAKFLRG